MIIGIKIFSKLQNSAAAGIVKICFKVFKIVDAEK